MAATQTELTLRKTALPFLWRPTTIKVAVLLFYASALLGLFGRTNANPFCQAVGRISACLLGGSRRCRGRLALLQARAARTDSTSGSRIVSPPLLLGDVHSPNALVPPRSPWPMGGASHASGRVHYRPMDLLLQDLPMGRGAAVTTGVIILEIAE